MSDDRPKRPLATPFPGRPATPVRGTPLPPRRPDDRDYQRPKTNPAGVPVVPRDEFSFEEKTAVETDVQVFHAVKALHVRLDKNETNAAAAHDVLTREVTALKDGFVALREVTEKQDDKLDKLAEGQAKVVGYIDGQRDADNRRSKSPSSMLRMVQETTTTTLAGRIVDDQLKSREWWRTQTAKLIGAAAGGGTLLEILHWLGVL